MNFKDHIFCNPDATAVPSQTVLAITLPVETEPVERAVVRVTRGDAVIGLTGCWTSLGHGTNSRRSRRSSRRDRGLIAGLLLEALL